MQRCDVCARKGVLIYPVRYAVACPAGAAEVPDLSGNFKIVDAPSNIGKAKFTLRTMRPGYMYTYDEKRKRLKAYTVLEDGRIWNFPIDYLAPRPPAVSTGCTNTAEIAFSRCIDIVHKAGDEATNIWIGWSNVMWTKPVIAKVDFGDWRRKHMQCVNVPALVAGTAAHTGEFKENHKKIAFFAISNTAMLKAFGYSNTSIEHEWKQQQLADIIVRTMAEHAPYNKGFIVAVNDPVGITNDLSELTLPTVDAGFDEDFARGKIIYDMLIVAEKSVREGAREKIRVEEYVDKVYEANPQMGANNYMATRSLWKMIKAGGYGKYKAKQMTEKQKYGDDLKGRQNAASDNAWEEHSSEEKIGETDKGVRKTTRTSVLDEERRKAFPAQYDAAIKKFQSENDLLSRSHVDWLASVQLANWMEGVHDTTDLRSGYAYSESVLQCIGKAVSSQLCCDHLIAWLNSGILSGNRNLYARALFFNHEELIRVLEPQIKSTSPQLKGSDIQLENFLNVYKLSLSRLEATQAERLIDRLALGTANVFLKVMRSSAITVGRVIALAHLSMQGGVIVRASGASASQYAKYIVAQSKAMNLPITVAPHVNQLAAHRQMEKVMRANPESPFVVGYEIVSSKVAADGVFGEGSIKAVKIPGFDSTIKWLGSSAPAEFHLGSVTAIVQLLAVGFALQDVKNGDETNQVERNFKAAYASVGLISTIVDVACTTAAKAPTHPLGVFLRSQWAISETTLKSSAKWAQRVGMVTGVIAGGYDIFVTAVETWGKEKYFLGSLIAINGAIGIAVAITAYFGLAIFWPLLLLSIVFSVVIALASSGALQEWISHCYFSKEASIVRAKTNGLPPFKPFTYSTAASEIKAFSSAIGI